MQKIKFGTSGWRGLLAEDFTFDRVRVVAQSIADYLKETAPGRPTVFVGYDTRFIGKRFAEAVASVFAGNGIAVIRSADPVPTPVVSFEILDRSLSGGVTVTASHNPPEWNGLKFSPAWGGPALPETTKQIERRANALLEQPLQIPQKGRIEAEREGLWRDEPIGDAYRERVLGLLDRSAFSQGSLRIAVDPFWGTSLGYLDRILVDMGNPVDLIHAERDANFGGIRPDPEGESLSDLLQKVQGGNYDLGLATDCDADRFGILDRDGTPIVPNYIIPLLIDYLVTDRKWTGKVARSVATSHLVDAVARHHRLDLIETPVGFKYIGELISKKEILLGGEESGGISIQGHLPEKDGILTCLLVAEMVAKRRRPLRAMLDDLFRRVGPFHPLRRDLHLSEEGKEKATALVKNPPNSLAGKKVLSVSRIDGVKLFLEGESWVLIRPSGTEPIVRLYAEASGQAESERLAGACEALIQPK